jgi:hypothetical protein
MTAQQFWEQQDAANRAIRAARKPVNRHEPEGIWLLHAVTGLAFVVLVVIGLAYVVLVVVSVYIDVRVVVVSVYDTAYTFNHSMESAFNSVYAEQTSINRWDTQ